MITETNLKQIFPEYEVIFDSTKSLLVFHYKSKDFDEKGYPKGLAISCNQIETLSKLNNDKNIAFALSTKDYIHQLRIYIDSQYLIRNLNYVKNTFCDVENYSYCSHSETLTKYCESIGTFKSIFSSTQIINLKEVIDSDRIKIRVLCYTLNYY